MGLGPRKKGNDVRSAQGKMVNPSSASPTKKGGSGAGASGMAVKRYTEAGKKYSGPNYPQKDKGVKPFSGK